MTARTPVVSARVLPRRYVDSIVAMRLAVDLSARAGVQRAAAMMGTPANKAQLAAGGFCAPSIDAAGADDLVVAVLAETEPAGTAALEGVDDALATRLGGTATHAARSLEDALRTQPASNVASISVPGEHAAVEARRALEAGLHVFCFSSGVSLEDEVALKELAASKGLLCMGPDCGTAILRGTGLGFSNAVRRGPVGVVGAAGTGIQAITTQLEQRGIGTSHAIGAGSRDLREEVGARTTLAALDALGDDPATELIVVVSKPGDPGPSVKVWAAAATSAKPVVVCLLGDERADAATLDDAVALVAGKLGLSGEELEWTAHPTAEECRGRLGSRRFVRGLFSGGSLCAEAQVVLWREGLRVRSNVPLHAVEPLDGGAVSHGHAMIDLGTEEFTRGLPHPMIDVRIRAARLAAEAADEDVAVVILDVVLGYNAAEDPAGALAPAIRDALRAARGTGSEPTIVASVVGTERDPQVRSRQEETLREAGAIVAPTSALATRFAASIVTEGAP